MSEGLTFYKPTTRYLVLACLGSLVLGVLVPCSLALLHHRGVLPSPDDFPGHLYDIPAQIEVSDVVRNSAALAGAALILCGPGAVILSAIAFGLLHKHRQAIYENQIMNGIFMGAGFSLLNLPGYLSVLFLDWREGQRALSAVRLILLFAVTGGTCGIWIAWQVWRSGHDGERFFPRYTLKTLMLMVLGWGLLLALFKPMTN